MAKKKPMVRKKKAPAMTTWTLELTELQLQILHYCTGVMGDMLQEDLDAGKRKNKAVAKEEITACRTMQVMAHLGIVNLEVSDHVRKKGLVK